MAGMAVFHLLTHAGNGFRKLQHVVFLTAQQIQHQSQSRLAPDAWQFGEFLYRLFQQF
jgi:hypothetical protein